MQGPPANSRNHWALSMGWVIYSVSEIDFQLIYVYGVLTNQESPIDPPANWNRKTTDEKVKLIEKLATKSPESAATVRFIRMCAEIKKLLDKRNHIAHGVLAIAGQDYLTMIKYDKKSGAIEEMRYEELLEVQKFADELSNKIDLLIFHCRRKEFVAPYVQGEPKEPWVITPGDPFSAD